MPTLNRATSTRYHLLFLTPLLRVKPWQLIAILAVGLSFGLIGQLTPSAFALSQEDSLEQRASSLDNKLICPACPGETLNQSMATLAKQMRQIIRDRLAAGESEQEIIDYFVSVYGDSVLAEPPRRGFALAIWIVPPLGLSVGLGLLVIGIRNLKRTVSANDLIDRNKYKNPKQRNLKNDLDLVDRELGED